MLPQVRGQPSPLPRHARRLSGGELFNRIVDKGSYPEPEAAELFAQILLSIEYLLV